MVNYYVNPLIGCDSWDGSSFSNPLDGKIIMNVFFSFVASSSSLSVTPHFLLIERQDYYNSTTTYLHHVAEYASAYSFGFGYFDNTISSSAGTKFSFSVGLIPADNYQVTFRSNNYAGANSTSVDCPPPSGIQNGDILIAFVTARQNSGNPAITPPSGWNLIATNTSSASNITHAIYWKRANNESGNYTFSHNGSSGQRIQVTIVDYYGCVSSGSPVKGYNDKLYTASDSVLRVFLPTYSGPLYSCDTRTMKPTIASGDSIRFIKTDAVTLGTCTFTNGSSSITIPSGLTEELYNGEALWSKTSADVTLSQYATYKISGSYSLRISIASGFTTGKIAWYPLSSQKDLSAYKAISLWIGASSSLPFGALKICLCSDNSGDTIVNEFFIPQLASTWNAFTLVNINNLSSTVNSIAIYAIIDPGVIELYVEKIIACKEPSSTGSISFSSLIGDYNDPLKICYPVLDISGTTVTIGGISSLSTVFSIKFYGDSGTKTGYIINPLPIYTNLFNLSYSVSNLTLTGGWSNESTQDGYSCFTGCKQNSACYISSTFNNIVVDRISFSKINHVLSLYNLSSSNNIRISNSVAANPANIIYSSVSSNINSINFRYCTFVGAIRIISEDYSNRNIIFDSSSFYRLYDTSTFISDCKFINCVSYDAASQYGSTSSSIILNSISEFYNCTFYNSGAVKDINTVGPEHRLLSCLFANGLSISGPTKIISINHNRTGNHLIYLNQYDTVQDESSIRHTNSGISWKLTLGSNTPASSDFPTKFTIAQVACSANTEVTVSVWLRRTNANLNVSLVCPKYQIAGVTNDVISSMTASANTWEEVSIKFTPTENGVVSIELWVYGGAYSVFIDDFNVSQE